MFYVSQVVQDFFHQQYGTKLLVVWCLVLLKAFDEAGYFFGGVLDSQALRCSFKSGKKLPSKIKMTKARGKSCPWEFQGTPRLCPRKGNY